jgi:hypothetical protein
VLLNTLLPPLVAAECATGPTGRAACAVALWGACAQLAAAAGDGRGVGQG